MSVDLVSIGRHTLDVSTVETASRQISERLDINIAIGYWDAGKYFPQEYIEQHPGAPFYRMWDTSDEYNPVQFDLEPPDKFLDSKSGDICHMIVYQETVYIDFWSVSWRWQWYWAPFGDEDDKGCLDDINRFRKVAREYYRKLGAEYIYCYADQGPSDLIGEYEDGTWEEFEAAIRTGKYLDCDYARKDWDFAPEDLIIFNVSDFLLGKTMEPSHSWWDVFYDDFKDLC